jgi:uncharacterized protein (TIGR03790 family)
MLAVLMLVLGGSVPAGYAQSAENVAVIINDADPASRQIGEYYARERGIPPENVIRIKTTSEDAITQAAFQTQIQQPIGLALARARIQDRVLYLVLTKGVPLRISGTTGQDGTMASVDSELAVAYRRMVGDNVLARGRIDNPYFLGTQDIREARPFTHREHDIFLVTRLDGFTVDDAIALVNRAKAPATEGRIVLDQRAALVNKIGDDWLAQAAAKLAGAGHGERVLLETTTKPARGISPVIGYFSWGSTDPQNRSRTVGMEFAPGALAASFVSTDARTLREPPPNWVPTNDTNRATWYAGSSHSLTGDLVREGVTGVAGHVAEPFLESAVRPEILFLAYLSGFNLAEAFYLAIPHLSWQTVVIGDPLTTPFPRRALTSKEIHDGIDPETEVPALFAARRLTRAMTALKTVADPKRAATLLMRAEGFIARGERGAEARQALEQFTELAPRADVPQFQLAMIYEAEGQHDAAIARYRKVLELQPKHVIALNNLAYGLAVHQKAAAEALPLAQQAAALAPNEPAILDTLGWVQHLAGDSAAAAKVMADVVRRAPGEANYRLHAAVVYAAVGQRTEAEAELKEALRLNPSLADSDEVKQLRARLQTMSTGR